MWQCQAVPGPQAEGQRSSPGPTRRQSTFRGRRRTTSSASASSRGSRGLRVDPRASVLCRITRDLLTSRSGGHKGTPPAQTRGLYPERRRRPAAGYFAAFFLRAAQEAFIRSDTASFSLAVIGRRFLVGVASDAVSATGVATAAGRCEEERRAAGFAGAEAPRILSTSFNALITGAKQTRR